MKILLSLSIIGSTLLAAHANWPQFLGPDGTGIATTGKPPLKWSETENVKWKTPVHGKAWSSPVVWGDQIWVTTATEDGRELSVLQLDKHTGKIVRDQKLFDIADPQFCHKFNSYASPTPVIEEGRVYATFGSPGTACLDTKTGRVLWQRTDFVCNHYRAAGSSPILYGDLLIMNFDGSDHQFIVALNKHTGETVWRTERSIDFMDLDASGQPEAEGDYRKAFATPHVGTIYGKPVLVSVGAKAAYGYDPLTGKERFRIESRIGHSSSVRPAIIGDTIYYTTGWSNGQLWAFKVRPDLSAGEDTIQWQLRRSVPNKPVPVVHGNFIFMVSDGGVASCVDRHSGELIWNERIGGNYSASPLLANDRLYCLSEEGKTVVLAAGREFQVLAENQLADGFMASPAVDDDALILRTKTHLYRVE
jgi:outer membrane protein assembly factor BamB